MEIQSSKEEKRISGVQFYAVLSNTCSHYLMQMYIDILKIKKEVT